MNPWKTTGSFPLKTTAPVFQKIIIIKSSNYFNGFPDPKTPEPEWGWPCARKLWNTTMVKSGLNHRREKVVPFSSQFQKNYGFPMKNKVQF